MSRETQDDDGNALIARLRDVSFGYKAPSTIIEKVSLDIRAGEILSLVGKSGCGKTTLLNMIAGLVKPWRGQVEFDGSPLDGHNTAVGYMTQEDTLLPWRTVWNNVALPLRLRKVSSKTIDKKVGQYLDLLSLGASANKYPAQLSGGMKRRALLARSVIYEPRMLLMDEPFSALDALMRESLQSELRSMAEKFNQTVLFVTHDVLEASLISDRIAVIGGSPKATVQNIFDTPFSKTRDLATLSVSEDCLRLQKDIRRALDPDASGLAEAPPRE